MRSARTRTSAARVGEAYAGGPGGGHARRQLYLSNARHMAIACRMPGLGGDRNPGNGGAPKAEPSSPAAFRCAGA